MATQAQIQMWASGMGLSYCVGDEFQQAHGGNLPASIAELTSWGDSTGRRTADGNWTCKGETTTDKKEDEDKALDLATIVDKYGIFILGGLVVLMLSRKK